MARRRYPGRQGWQGRGVARVAGRQKVATPAGSRVAKKMTGSLLESKNSSFTPQYWTRTITITEKIEFLHRYNETFGLNSMSNLEYVYSYS